MPTRSLNAHVKAADCACAPDAAAVRVSRVVPVSRVNREIMDTSSGLVVHTFA